MATNRKKGFTLVEVVIAMTIMAAIAVLAIMSVIQFVNVNKSCTDKVRGINEVSNVLECFKTDDFEESLKFYYGTEEAPYTLDNIDDNVYWFYYKGDYSVLNDIEGYQYAMKVTINGNSFSAQYSDNTGKIIYEMPKTYVKGA